MTNLIPFNFNDYLVRVHKDGGGDPWFMAKDVCAVLSLDNVGQAISTLDDDEKNSITINDGTPGSPVRAIVNEPGLYSLIFRSRKPEAKSFKRWVTHEVLPSIRKTGFYAAPRPERAKLELADLPDDLTYMKPSARERCLFLAQRTANLSGLTSPDDIHGLFVDYCRVMTAAPTDGHQSPQQSQIGDYINANLTAKTGGRLSAYALYQDFIGWWSENGQGHCPSRRVFGGVMSLYYRKIKSNNNFYCDVAFSVNRKPFQANN